MAKRERSVIGWREWVSLPALGIDAVKAKVDTGARSSALHASDIQYFTRDGVEFVRFSVHPIQRTAKVTIVGEEELVEKRWITSSVGHRTLRPVIITPISWMGQTWDIELTLVNRDAMGFRMLIGRQAMRQRLIVDPTRSYVSGKPESTKVKRVKKKKKKKKKMKRSETTPE